MAVPIAPIIAGAAAAGSAMIGNAGTKRAAKYAAKANLKQWLRQNEYNHPSAQMARLREAGLNPNLIYGTSPTSAVGNAESIAPVKAPDYKFDNPLADIDKFANLKQIETQTDNLKTQNTVMTQEAILKAAQQAETAARTAKTHQDTSQANDLHRYSMDAARENVRQIELSNIGKELDNTIKDKGMRDVLKDIYYRAEHAKSQLQGQDLTNELRQLEIDLKKLGIERNDPWYFRILGRQYEKLGTKIRDTYEDQKRKQAQREYDKRK